MKTTVKECLYCKQSFNADNREVNRGNAKYCSLSCQRKQYNNTRSLKNCKCLVCNTNYQSVNTKSKYCSTKCKTKYYRISILFLD